MERGQFKRRHLAFPLLKEFINTHCILDPYKVEIYKGCWHSKLRALQAQHAGDLPSDEVARLYSTFKCKFGCPPPLTPASIFVGMHEVPRHMKTSTSMYDSFEDTYGKPTPIDLPPLKPGALVELAPSGVLDKEKVQATIRCTWCGLWRCVYVKMKLSAVTRGAPPGCTLKHMLLNAIEANQGSYTCGADLDLRGYEALEGNCRPYVRLKLDCSQHVELQLYSSNIMPYSQTEHMCAYCGEDGTRRQPDNEASDLLPVCDPCYEQHRKARYSGRQVERFDRSGQRSARQQASQRREAQVDSALREQDAAVGRFQREATSRAPRDHQGCGGGDAGGEASDMTQGEDVHVHRNEESPGHAQKRRRICEEGDETGDDECDQESDESDSAAEDADAVPVSLAHPPDSIVFSYYSMSCFLVSQDYFVKQLHNVRKPKNKPLEFLIEWENFPDCESFTWEPVKNLPNNHSMIWAFKEQWVADGKRWPANWRVPTNPPSA